MFRIEPNSECHNFFLRCGGIFCVALKYREGLKPPLLEPFFVVASATWRKEDTERTGSFAFGSESL